MEQVQWFLFRKASFSFIVLALENGEMVRKCSFHDDRGQTARYLIDEAKRVQEEADHDLTTIQQILIHCKPVRMVPNGWESV